jgi:hypothetical protein
MRIPPASELLEAWERGRAAAPAARALLLLQTAWPEHSADELAQLPLGRRNALLMALRARCLGDAITGVAHCPRCSEPVEVGFAPAQMGMELATDALPSDSAPHELSFGAFRARFRLPTTQDLRGLGDVGDPLALGRRLVASCMIDVRRGNATCSEHAWPDALVEAVAERMSELDPHADITLAVNCASCGHEWQQALDVGEFLYGEFAARARRLLDEVVRLASAFGWSEREILALPPARRQSYLERLEA